MSQWQPRQYDPQAHQRRMGAPVQFPREQQPAPVFTPGYQEQPQPPRDYPPPQPPAPRPARSWPPYPAHLTRFPSQALPRSRRRRGRGPSLGRIIYLGRHPIALLIAAYITAIVFSFVYAWVAFVVMGWAFWVAAVTAGWLCQMAAAALRRN